MIPRPARTTNGNRDHRSAGIDVGNMDQCLRRWRSSGLGSLTPTCRIPHVGEQTRPLCSKSEARRILINDDVVGVGSDGRIRRWHATEHATYIGPGPIGLDELVRSGSYDVKRIKFQMRWPSRTSDIVQGPSGSICGPKIRLDYVNALALLGGSDSDQRHHRSDTLDQRKPIDK